MPVAAGTQEVRLLDALAPGTTRFAVHVHVRSGRVAAAVRDQQIDGLTPRGADWLPAAAPPARPRCCPASSRGTGERSLQVVAPGDSDAIVKVRLITESGSFAPGRAGRARGPGRLGRRRRPGAVHGRGRGRGVAGLRRAGHRRRADPGDRRRRGADRRRLHGCRPTDDAGDPGRRGRGAAGRAGSPARCCSPPSGADATVRLAPLPPATGTPTEVRVPGGSQVVRRPGHGQHGAELLPHRGPAPGSGPVLRRPGGHRGGGDGPAAHHRARRPGRYTVSCRRSSPTCRPACGRAASSTGRLVVPVGVDVLGRTGRAARPPPRPPRRAPGPRGPGCARGPRLDRPAVDDDPGRLAHGRPARPATDGRSSRRPAARPRPARRPPRAGAPLGGTPGSRRPAPARRTARTGCGPPAASPGSSDPRRPRPRRSRRRRRAVAGSGTPPA